MGDTRNEAEELKGSVYLSAARKLVSTPQTIKAHQMTAIEVYLKALIRASLEDVEDKHTE